MFTKRVGPAAMNNRINSVLRLAEEYWEGQYCELAAGYGSHERYGYTEAVPVLVTTLDRRREHGPPARSGSASAAPPGRPSPAPWTRPGQDCREMRRSALAATKPRFSAGADDPPLFVATDVHLTLVLAAGEGAGGEVFDQALIVRAQALEDGDEGAERGGGDHVRGVFLGLQEDGHDDAGDLRGAVAVRRSARPLLLTLPGVRNAAALGVPDEEHGEAVQIFLATAEGALTSTRKRSARP